MQRRRKLESEYQAIIQELANLRSSYDEECELRIDIERKYSNECASATQYKSKWEIEVRSRADEVDEIKWELSRVLIP